MVVKKVWIQQENKQDYDESGREREEGKRSGHFEFSASPPIKCLLSPSLPSSAAAVSTVFLADNFGRRPKSREEVRGGCKKTRK